MVASAPRPLVIIVEDDAGLRAALTFSLEAEGYEVRGYGDAESLFGLAMPDADACLVIDERLPGMSGAVALTELRARGVGLPAIVITTNPKPSLRDAASAADAIVLEKPLLGDALLEPIRALMAGGA